MRRYSIPIACMAAALAVLLAIWRVSFISSRESESLAAMQRETRTVAAAAEALFKSLEPTAISIASVGDSEQEWHQFLSRAATSSPYAPDSLRAGQERAVLDAAASFLYHRLVAFDVDEYVRWREEEGYLLNSIDELKRNYLFQWYETNIGQPPPDNPDAEQMFRDVVAVSDRYFENAQVPSLIATDSEAISVALAECSNPSGTDCFPRLEEGIGPDAWHGGNSLGFADWWAPPSSYFGLLDKHGSVLLASVGVVIRYETSDWRSLILFYHFDPDRDNWFLVDVAQYNTDSPTKVGAWDY